MIRIPHASIMTMSTAKADAIAFHEAIRYNRFMMNADRELIRAIDQMRRGSRNGFIVFFNKTFQFTCLWTAKLMADTVRRDDYLSEFYPYALLHIAELSENEKVFSWLEQILPLFYELWSGESFQSAIKPLHPSLPDDSAVKASADIVFAQVMKNIDFPKQPQPARLPFSLIVLAFLSVAAVLFLLIMLQRSTPEDDSHARIDEINQQNMIYSTNPELNDYLTNFTISENGDTVTEEYIIHEPTTE